jgi:hypothetical protein
MFIRARKTGGVIFLNIIKTKIYELTQTTNKRRQTGFA